MTTQTKIMASGMPAMTAVQIAGDNTSGITALGATQGTAQAVFSDINVVTVAALSTGVILPSNRTVNDSMMVANLGANALSVYPPVGGNINAGAVNVAFSVPVAKVATFWQTSAVQWIALLSA